MSKVSDAKKELAELGTDLLNASCPMPVSKREQIVIGHGSGGKLSAQLMEQVFYPEFANPMLDRRDDQAVFEIEGARLAFTTDSYVVTPIFFPGGDIGKLAVNGTVNDLAMSGARPLYLSAAFVLEEGLPVDELKRVVASMKAAAEEAGVKIVTGDTKVVERGKGDKLFINTSGVGVVDKRLKISASNAKPGDKIILSGSIGDHGIVILSQREGLGFDGEILSDSAPLNGLVERMIEACADIRVMRDPTRGGLASTLNEIAATSRVGIKIEERALPVHEVVRGACALLGLDPLYVANEGKLVAIVPAEAADAVVAAMRSHKYGEQARVIGEVTDGTAGMVVMKTDIGGTRIVDTLPGEQLPRIC